MKNMNRLICQLKDEKEYIVTTFKQVVISDIELPAIAIYDSPSEYPEYFVARILDYDKLTNTLMLKKDIESIRRDIRKSFPYARKVPIGDVDDEHLVEMWV